jgi:hypothetical protein
MYNYKKTIIIFFLLSFFVLTINAGSVLGNRKIETKSHKDIAEMEKLIIRLFNQTYKTEDYDAIKKAILEEVEVNFPVVPGSKIRKVDFKQIEKECEEKANEKFPLNNEQLKQKFEQEAQIKFSPVKLKEEVEVEYRMGADTVVRVKGKYYGFNRYHNGIIIGRKVVPVFDLLPMYRVKFVDNYRGLAKKNYIDENVTKYLREKEKYTVEQINETIKNIGQMNENAGYIMAWRMWRTPEQIADFIYKHHLVEYMKKNKSGSKPSSKPPSSSSIKPPATRNISSTASKPSGNTAIERQAQKILNTEGSAAKEISKTIKKKEGALDEVLNALD